MLVQSDRATNRKRTACTPQAVIAQTCRVVSLRPDTTQYYQPQENTAGRVGVTPTVPSITQLLPPTPWLKLAGRTP